MTETRHWKSLLSVAFVLLMTALLMTALLITALPTSASNEAMPDPKQETPQCHEIQTLLEKSQNDFKDIRHSPRITTRMTIWQTNDTLAGNRCEVWQWGKGNFSYVCTKLFPDRESGELFIKSLTPTLDNCLGKDFNVSRMMTEPQPDTGKRGERVLYQAQKDKRRVDIRLMEKQGIFDEEWMLYFLITGPNGVPLREVQ